MGKPTLTEAACELLADEYANLRSDDFEDGVARTQTVTARALETLIRLSTAHARLSKTVEVEDAELAIELVQFAYFKKVLDKGKRRKSQESESEDDVEEQEEVPETASKRKRSEEGEETPSKRSRKDLLAPEPAPVPVSVDESRYKYFMELLNKCVFEKNQA